MDLLGESGESTSVDARERSLIQAFRGPEQSLAREYRPSATASVDPVERLSVELVDAVPTQPQIAPTVLVDGHDALARKPVFFGESPQRLTVVSPSTLLGRSEPDVASTVFSD